MSDSSESNGAAGPDGSAALSAPAVEPLEAQRPSSAPLEALAVIALVAGILLLSVVAIVLGYWAQRRIRREGTRGAGIARLAIVLGLAELAVTVVFWAVYFIALAPLVTLPR